MTARSNISKAFLEALEADFAKHGRKTIELLRKDNPRAYLALAARMLSRPPIEKDDDDRVIEVKFVA